MYPSKFLMTYFLKSSTTNNAIYAQENLEMIFSRRFTPNFILFMPVNTMFQRSAK